MPRENNVNLVTGENEMPAATKPKTTAEREAAEAAELAALEVRKKNIGSGVLTRIGTPPTFERIDVINIYGTRYRVNVLSSIETKIGDSMIGFRRITDSFFVVANPDGDILRADPDLAPRYSRN